MNVRSDPKSAQRSWTAMTDEPTASRTDGSAKEYCDTLFVGCSRCSAQARGQHAVDADADPPKLLLIGPDESANLLEIIAIELAERQLLVIHAMPLRRSFRRLIEGDTR